MFENKKEKNAILAFSITFIAGIITHFMIFLTESMAPDALATGVFKISGFWEMSLGRWGIVFFDSIRGGIVNEIIIILFCLIFLGLASVIICKMLRIESKWGIIINSLILATAPQFSETFMFIYCADSYCFSVLAASLSAYFISKSNEKKYNIVIGILFGIISLSIYQAYIAVTVVLTIIYFIIKILREELKTRELILQFIKNMVIILISMVCYFVITKIFLAINGIEFASYKGADSLSMVNIIKNLPTTIKNSYFIVKEYLFGNYILLNSYWKRNIFNTLLCIINILFLVFVLIKNKVYKNKVNLILLIALLIVFPIGINVISIIMPDTLTNIVTGPALLCIYMMFIAVIENNKFKHTIYKIIKVGNILLLSILIFTYIMSDNATYMARQEVHTNYFSISTNILHKVYDLDEYSQDKKWIFTDNIRYRSKFASMANGTISNDYETWDNVDGIWMNYQFYERYLGENIKMATKEEYYEIVETKEVKEMEAYPSKNCVKIIGDFIVVKIGNQSYTR